MRVAQRPVDAPGRERLPQFWTGGADEFEGRLGVQAGEVGEGLGKLRGSEILDQPQRSAL